MTDEPFEDPEDEFREMMRKFLSGEGMGEGMMMSPEEFAKAAGLPIDPSQLSQMMQNIFQAASSPSTGLNVKLAEENAIERAQQEQGREDPANRDIFLQHAQLAELWLSDVTAVSQNPEPLIVASRTLWVRKTLNAWVELGSPVAENISKTLSESIDEQLPEEFAGLMKNAEHAIKGIGSSLFSIQLGQTIGDLSQEVLTGGDIGLNLTDSAQPMVVTQNINEFAADLDVPIEEVQLYFVVRELAHARIFKHAKWLSLAITNQLNEHAKGFTINTIQLNDIADSFDPSDPDAMRELIMSGELIPEKTPEQLAALKRLETLLALLEGWIAQVTQDACSRLPKFAAIDEAFRRRRATGGPAEQAFNTLVGLEIRPKIIREAKDMWAKIQDAVGVTGRDELWANFDFLPEREDIEDPNALIARLQNDAPELDEMDEELLKLLDAGLPDVTDEEDSSDTPPNAAEDGDNDENSDDDEDGTNA